MLRPCHVGGVGLGRSERRRRRPGSPGEDDDLLDEGDFPAERALRALLALLADGWRIRHTDIRLGSADGHDEPGIESMLVELERTIGARP